MSSTSAQPSPPRAGSYILVPSSAPLDASVTAQDAAELAPRSRPRLFWLLPLVAVLDIVISLTLGAFVLRQEIKHKDPTIPNPSPNVDDAAWERKKIILTVLAFSLARSLSYLIVGFSLRIRQLGVTVAATSILSTLFYASIANLLFQARSKPSTVSALFLFAKHWKWADAFKHFEPTMPILVGVQFGFTVLEWVLYIAVVGVKVPPGGNVAAARKWQRGLSNDEGYQRGVDAHSLCMSDGEEGVQERRSLIGSKQGDDSLEDADLEQARSLLASPHSIRTRNGGQTPLGDTEQPLLGANPSTPRTYGSTLNAPRTPQGPSHTHSASSQLQGSVRSNRSAKTQGMSRSTSARSGLYSRSPNTAEQALVDEDESEEEEHVHGEEEEAEGSDPDDIIDITPNRAVARKEARLRLARAALPERRASGGTLSTLSIFGPGGSTTNDSETRAGPRGNNVFSDEAGSPLGRSDREQLDRPTLMSVATSPELTRPGGLADESRQSSMPLLPSSSSTRTSSTKGSSKKFKLPKWMKPRKK